MHIAVVMKEMRHSAGMAHTCGPIMIVPPNQNGPELPCERISIMDDCPPCCLDDYLCYESMERDRKPDKCAFIKEKGHMGETYIQLRVVY